jgi:cytosine/creatinine deaminase
MHTNSRIYLVDSNLLIEITAYSSVWLGPHTVVYPTQERSVHESAIGARSGNIHKFFGVDEMCAEKPAEKENAAKYLSLLKTAIEEARQGLAEGGIPIGAALFTHGGKLLGRGHNRRIQENDPSVHGETDAFRKAGRQRSYRDKIMVTTLAPCWYCSGLVRQFGIGTVVVGEAVNFQGGVEWLRENGVNVIDLHSTECIDMLAAYIAANPAIWHEDIGED